MYILEYTQLRSNHSMLKSVAESWRSAKAGLNTAIDGMFFAQIINIPVAFHHDKDYLNF